MYSKTSSVLFCLISLFQLVICHDEARIIAKAYELSEQYPQEASLTTSDIEKLTLINMIIRNSLRSVSRRLTDIKALTVRMVREKAKGASGLTDDQIWSTQEGKFRGLLEKNDQLVRRLQQPDVTDDVRDLDDEIQGLYSRLDMYKNGRFYVLDAIKSVLSKASDAAFSSWENIRDEIYGDNKCPPGFTMIRNSCYTKLTGKFDYNLAVKACKLRHSSARLPEINDKYTNDALVAKFGIGFLLGLKRESPKSNNFVYENGKPPIYYNWYSPYEPNNAGSGESCVQALFDGGKWNDNNCNNVFEPIVCQTELATSAISLQQRQDKRCPPGFEFYHRSCYAALEGVMNYNTAQKKCKVLHPNAHLPIIANKQENDALIEKFGRAWWVGVMRAGPAHKTFVDVLGRTPRYYNWYSPQEPNNMAGVEHCAETYGLFEANGQWNDASCENKTYAFCQVEPSNASG